jgi:hypothetical protein
MIKKKIKYFLMVTLREMRFRQFKMKSTLMLRKERKRKGKEQDNNKNHREKKNFNKK